MSVVESNLREGHAMLLVDGLDEISEPSHRLTFVKQLTLFLLRYPTISIILTSREAGFRVVGSALDGIIHKYSLAPFDEDDVMRLTLAWHKEVVGDKPDVKADAERLAASISNTPRVMQLASNPLLLTTLLLVKRWVGSLPTKRSVLYAKAIEVLLATWNVEGHKPLEQDEVLPQLEYVAHAMMIEGVQQLGAEHLKTLLVNSRRAMPELLSYTSVTPNEFLEGVELRSSILMQSGHELLDAVLTPVYEFRHLTFQEYLTAKALVNGHFSGFREADSLVDALRPYIPEYRWKEVIQLALSLAGRRAGAVIEYIVSLAETARGRSEREHDIHAERFGSGGPAGLLLGALIDEVQMSPEVLQKAVDAVLLSSLLRDNVLTAVNGKYGSVVENRARTLFETLPYEAFHLGGLIVKFNYRENNRALSGSLQEAWLAEITQDFSSQRWQSRAEAALCVMEQGWYGARNSAHSAPVRQLQPEEMTHVLGLIDQLTPMLDDSIYQVRICALWAIAWLAERAPNFALSRPQIFAKSLGIWRQSQTRDEAYLASWVIGSSSMVPKELKPFGDASADVLSFLQGVEQTEEGSRHWQPLRNAGKIVAFYLGSEDDLHPVAKDSDYGPTRHLTQLGKHRGIEQSDDQALLFDD